MKNIKIINYTYEKISIEDTQTYWDTGYWMRITNKKLTILDNLKYKYQKNNKYFLRYSCNYINLS